MLSQQSRDDGGFQGKMPESLLYVFAILLFSSVYFLSARLGLSLSTQTAQVSLVWPPTGIAIAILLIFGVHYWPAILIGAFGVNFITNETFGVASAISIGNTLEAVVAIFVLRRGDFHVCMDRLRDVLFFIFCAAVLSTMVSASIGTLALLAGGQVQAAAVAQTWMTWWSGDLMGALVIGPALLQWLSWDQSFRLRTQWLEGVLLLAAHIALFSMLFLAEPGTYPGKYLAFPLLLYSAVRFEQFGAVSSSFLTYVFLVVATVQHQGQYEHLNLLENSPILSLLFIIVVSTTAQMIGAIIAERDAALIREKELADKALGEKDSAIREQEKFLDSIIENIPNMVFVKDAKDLRFVRFNRAGERLIGAPRENLLGKCDYDFFPMDQADFFVKKDRKVLEGKLPVDIPSEPLQTMYGKTKVLHTKKVPILDDEGKPSYLLGISEDITEQIAMEEELKKAKAKDEATLGALNASALVSITDAQGNILYVNELFVDVSKYAREELIGQNHRILKSGLQSDEVFTGLWKTISSGKVWRGDIQNRAKDGSLYWSDTSIAPVLNAHGVPELYVSVRFLITERKKIEEVKSSFVSLASHQLRSPLTSVRWLLSRLSKDQAVPPRQRIMLTEAHHAAMLMSEAIRTMLVISEVEAGVSSPGGADVDVAILLKDIIATLEWCWSDRNIVLDVNCPGITFHTDEQYLREILTNLLTNACTYSQDGSHVTVTAGSDTKTMTIVIADTGCGIPAQEHDRVFTKFFRGNNVVSGKTKGTGLGLYLVRLLVDLLHGSITFTSEENVGTVFTLTIPRQPHHDAQEKARIDR